jgi:rubrerythrin
MPSITSAKAPVHPRTYDWTRPARWVCPRCDFATLTREAAPRCSACGYRESGD